MTKQFKIILFLSKKKNNNRLSRLGLTPTNSVRTIQYCYLWLKAAN